MSATSAVSTAGESVTTEDGNVVFVRSWRPRTIRAVVAAVHAPSAKGARYAGLAEALAARDIATYAVDPRGRGQSPGIRLPLALHKATVCDVHAMVMRVRQLHAQLPLFLLGQGRGAALACRYALRQLHVADGIVCEGIVLPPHWVQRMQYWRQAMMAALWRTQPPPQASLANLGLPLLLLHGSDDRTRAPASSAYLHGHAAATDKTLQVFEGYAHDLLDGPGHALVQDKIGDWIQAQLSAGSGRRRIGIQYINE